MATDIKQIKTDMLVVNIETLKMSPARSCAGLNSHVTCQLLIELTVIG